MKKIQKVESKKLKLNHETVRELQRAQLELAVGAYKEYPTPVGCTPLPTPNRTRCPSGRVLRRRRLLARVSGTNLVLTGLSAW